MQLVTKAEYARRRGVSGAAVTQAVKAGRLTLVDGKVNLETADAEWGGKSRPRVNSQPAVKAQILVPAERAQPEVPDDADLSIPPWQDSKARQAHLDAEVAEIELGKLRGTLIEKAKVRAEYARQAKAVADGLLNIPARLAPVLHAAKSLGEVQTLLDTEIRAVLAQLVGSD